MTDKNDALVDALYNVQHALTGVEGIIMRDSTIDKVARELEQTRNRISTLIGR